MKHKREWPRLTWLWIIIAGLLITIGVWFDEALGDTYETYFRYSDTTADSVVWNVFIGGDTLVNGKASKWKGENSGLWIDTITIGSQSGLWIDFLIWTGTDYDPSGYYLNQRANMIAIAGDSTAANDIDARIDTLVDTTVAIYTEIVNIDGWNPITTNESLVVAMAPLADRPVIGDTIGRNASTFDPTTDSVIVDVSSADAGLIPAIEDTIYANAADYKADVSNLALASGIDSLYAYADSTYDTLLLVQAEVANIDAWAPITDNDSLIVDQSSLEDMTVATVTDVTNQVTADVTAISGDSDAADSLEEACDGYDNGGLTLFERIAAVETDVTNIDGWTPIIDNDSLIIDQSTLSERPAIGDTSQGVDEVLAEVVNIDAWNPITDDDSLVIDQSTLEDMTVATVTDVTNQVTADITAVDGDAGAADTLEAWLDGYADAQLTNREHLFTNLDEVLSARSKIGDTSSGVDEVQTAVSAIRDSMDEASQIGSGIDSATTSRIIGRKVWGVAAGSGSDSTALASRKAHVESMKAGVVTASIIADDAIDYATFAASAPSAWWNEGKAGYTVSTVGDKTGYALSTAGIDGIWEYDTAIVDAGMGKLLRDTSAYQGSASAITDAQMGAIADSVFNRDTADHNVAQSYGVLLKDTTAYQGAASGLTEEGISDAVWDELQSGHTTQGTFGAYLDDTVSGISLSPDSGSNVLTLIALDTSGDTSNVPFLKHSCQSVDGSVDYSFKYTESDGTETWALDNDSFIFTTSGYNYIQQTVPDTVVVFGNTTDTLRLYPFDPGGPVGAGAASKCRVWSRIFSKDDGTGREGIKVSVTTPYKLRYGNIPIYQFAESTSTDSTGYWYFDLIKSDSLTPSAKAAYRFIAKDTLEIVPVFDVKAKVPDTSSWQLRYWRE